MKREDRPRNVYERARKTKRQVGERHGEERRRRMHTVGEKEEKEGREWQKRGGGECGETEQERERRIACAYTYMRVWCIRDKERDVEERRERERREDRSSHESTRWRTIRNERPAVVFFWSVTRLADRASDWFLSAPGNVHCVQQPPPTFPPRRRVASSALATRVQCTSLTAAKLVHWRAA